MPQRIDLALCRSELLLDVFHLLLQLTGFQLGFLCFRPCLFGIALSHITLQLCFLKLALNTLQIGLGHLE